MRNKNILCLFKLLSSCLFPCPIYSFWVVIAGSIVLDLSMKIQLAYKMKKQTQKTLTHCLLSPLTSHLDWVIMVVCHN